MAMQPHRQNPYPAILPIVAGMAGSAVKRAYTYSGNGNGTTKKFKKAINRRTGGYQQYSRPGELKFYDHYNTSSEQVVGPSVVFDADVAEVAQGTGESQRIGRKIRIHGLYVRWHITLNSSATTGAGHDQYRCMILWDGQANGANALYSDVYDLDQSTGNESEIMAFKNLEQGSRFRLLYDKRFVINAQAQVNNASMVYNQIRTVYLNFKKPLIINYSGTTGAISERDKSISVRIVSEHGNMSAVAQTRLRYTD